MHEIPPTGQPKQPPPIPSGWEPAAPDFVGVGTMRSGTSWWWQMITSHPLFARTGRGKEIHFFDHHMGVADVDPAAYHRYFPKPQGGFSGEWTPRYIYDYWTPPMLRRVAPHTRLLVMLRDPVERFLSGLAFTTARGFPATPALLHYHFERSLYGQQLRTLLAHFPAEQVLVLQYERCAAEPVRFMRETLEFIGVDPRDWRMRQPAGRRVNATRAAKPDLDPADREALTLALRADVATLFELAPGLDPSVWPTARS